MGCPFKREQGVQSDARMSVRLCELRSEEKCCLTVGMCKQRTKKLNRAGDNMQVPLVVKVSKTSMQLVFRIEFV